MPELDVTPEELRLVTTFLRQSIPDREVWAFGSRVRGKARPNSDLDLAILGPPVPVLAMADLREAFEESPLRFKVDLVEWARASPAFRAIIEKDHVVLVKGEGLQGPQGPGNP